MMFKRIFIVFMLLFIFINIHPAEPSFSNNSNGTASISILEINAAYAAQQTRHSENTPTPWQSYIVPVSAGTLLIISIGSYWLVFKRRNHRPATTKKEA